MKNMGVNARLFVLVIFLSLVSVVVGLVGLNGMSQAVSGLETVYNDRVVPLRDLKVIADMYAVNIVDTSHKVRNGNLTWEEGRKALAEAETTIASKWKSYKATFLVEKEKKLVAEIAEAAKAIADLEARMRTSSYLHLTRFVRYLLDRKDRMSMASGLEVRVPFCDHRLVDPRLQRVPQQTRRPQLEVPRRLHRRAGVLEGEAPQGLAMRAPAIATGQGIDPP